MNKAITISRSGILSRKMKTLFLSFLIYFSYSTLIKAQPFSEIVDIDLLSNEEVVLVREHPHMLDTLRIIDIYDIDGKHSKIAFYEEGIYCEAIVNSERKDLMLVATGVGIPQDEVPEIVMDVVKEGDFGSWEIYNTMVMRTPYSPWFYAIDVRQDSVHLRLFYNSKGVMKNAPY